MLYHSQSFSGKDFIHVHSIETNTQGRDISIELNKLLKFHFVVLLFSSFLFGSFFSFCCCVSIKIFVHNFISRLHHKKSDSLFYCYMQMIRMVVRQLCTAANKDEKLRNKAAKEMATLRIDLAEQRKKTFEDLAALRKKAGNVAKSTSEEISKSIGTEH